MSITMIDLTQYLNEIKVELQELYSNLDDELRNTDNQQLIDDSYYNVTSKLEEALTELDTLIADVDGGVYEETIDLDADDEYDQKMDDIGWHKIV